MAFFGELLDYLESVSAGYLIKVKLKGLVGLLEGQKWESAGEVKAGSNPILRINVAHGIVQDDLWR